MNPYKLTTCGVRTNIHWRRLDKLGPPDAFIPGR